MKSPASHPSCARLSGPSQAQRRERNHRHLPLTDDQYVATSLALVADLALRVRLPGSRRHG